jgi:hypothetical protein
MNAVDTRAQINMSGQFYYRQMDDLAINLCVAKKISDPQWVEFLERSVRLAEQIGRMPKVTVAVFTGAYPDVMQRRLIYDFLEQNKVPPITRLAVVSDNPLLRSAIVAFSWVVPKASARAFGSRDVEACFHWLREVATFDETEASHAWSEACAALQM